MSETSVFLPLMPMKRLGPAVSLQTFAAGTVICFLYSTRLVVMTPTQWVAENSFGAVWGFVNMSLVLVLFEFLRKRWK